MFYLVRIEGSYQCIGGSLYGLVCFYNNKCVLIKVALEVSIDGTILPIIFTMQKVRFIPYNSAQNNSWKLVDHSFKVGTLSQTIIGFPIGNVQ